MKRVAAAFLCVLLVVMSAQADEAATTARKRHKLFDRKLILAGLTMLTGEIADNETTLAVARRNRHVSELNPFYGAHPSRLRIYSIGTALTGLMFLTTAAARQRALRRGREASKTWLIPVMIHDAARGLAAWHNAGIPASHPHLLRVCPAAGAGCR